MRREDCTFDTTLAEICEVAADTLEVDRVNVWLVDANLQLRCVHAYVRSISAHNPPGFEETLPLDSEYGIQLDEVRVIDIADVDNNAVVFASHEALGAYLSSHDIHSLLDAPIRAEGELLGVVCHEHVGSARMWTPEDHAFAGSIGDYIAVAYEIARRREIENRLRFLERHEAQTNLPNRDHLLEVAHTALRPLQRTVALWKPAMFLWSIAALWALTTQSSGTSVKILVSNLSSGASVPYFGC